MILAVNSSAPISSTRTSWHQWLSSSRLLFSLLLLIMVTTSVASFSISSVSYADHCASVVPESTPTVVDNTISPLQTYVTYHTGGERILGNVSTPPFYGSQRLIISPTKEIYRTKNNDIYHMEAYLSFQSPYRFNFGNSTRHVGRDPTITFLLSGFWSKSSGKLCMVGSASWSSEKGKSRNLEAALKLNYVADSSILSSLIDGTLESLSPPADPGYFEPISILAFGSGNYKYTLAKEEIERGSDVGLDEIRQNLSLSPQPGRFCQQFYKLTGFATCNLEYANECSKPSQKACSVLDPSIGYLPDLMSLYAIGCSDAEQSLRFLLKFENNSQFRYNRNFAPMRTLVAEGSWDAKKNRLHAVACRILDHADPKGNRHVGNCSIRISLRYPALLSLRSRSTILGEIWSNKTAADPGYFKKIKFRDNNEIPLNMVALGWRYEYTEVERANKSCSILKPAKNRREIHPKASSNDLRFDMSIVDSSRTFGWGYAEPLLVGDQIFQAYPMYNNSEARPNRTFIGPVNISYTIIIQTLANTTWGNNNSLSNSSTTARLQISAEGLYDDQTGQLCLVGCRKLESEDNQKSADRSLDCEMLLNFQFPPVNAKKGGGFITGSITSTRTESDPLYFRPINISSTAFYTTEAINTIWRMDLEIIMALITKTLACLFVAFQLFHVKRNPGVLSFASLSMVVILTLGYMVPLVLNFEAVFFENQSKKNKYILGGGWLEANEVVVRVVTMMAFLLQLRLLQLVWSARLAEEGSQRGHCAAESKALLLCSPFYIMGMFIALMVYWSKNSSSSSSSSSSSISIYSINSVQKRSLWAYLRSYGGLVLDGFLFPQIIQNMFQFSRGAALTPLFYVGTTFVRVLPHAYDLYRAHNYARCQLDGSCIFADPNGDFYSTALDVIIPCMGLLLAGIIFLQQRFGGRCILPKKFREAEEYEMVPVVSNA